VLIVVNVLLILFDTTKLGRATAATVVKSMIVVAEAMTSNQMQKK